MLFALDFQQFPSNTRPTFYAADGSPSVLDYFFIDQSIRITERGRNHHHLQFQHLAIAADIEATFNDQAGTPFFLLIHCLI